MTNTTNQDKQQLRVSYDSLVYLYGERRVNREIDLELESKELAKNKFLHDLYALSSNQGNKLKERKQVALRGTGGTLLKEALPIYTTALSQLFRAMDNGKPGKRHVVCKLFRELQPDHIAYVTLKTLLSRVIKTPTISLTALCDAVGSDIEQEVRFNKLFSKVDSKEAKLLEKGLAKRQGLSYREAYLKAQENRMIEDGELEGWKKWSKEQKVTAGLKLVEIFCESTGLGKLSKQANGQGKYYYTFVFDQMMVDYIHHNDEALADMAFKYRPMVIPPKDWTDPYDGGYYLSLKRPAMFVKDSRSDVQDVYESIDMPEVYKAVNAIQKTAWRINGRVLDVAQAILEWTYIPEGLDVPSKTAEEPPVKPEPYVSDSEEAKAWRLSMTHYYHRQASNRGKRILVDALISLAQAYRYDEEIYFPHNVDFRGRVYPLTTLSPQGNDLSKSLLEFADGVPLGESGAKWLAFHGANCYGLDKKPLAERLSWVYENSDLIISIAKDPLTNLQWCDTDSPWEFLAFCFEWADYQTYGEAYKSHLAVAFDGSCSGLQHFSAILRDEIGGKAVNLIPSDTVQDIYKVVADKVNAVLKKDAENGSEDTVETLEDGSEYLRKGTKSMAQEWLSYGVTRKVTKRSTMTLCYGAKQYGFADQIMEDTIIPAIGRLPTSFSKPKQSAKYMAKLIWDALGSTVVKAMEAMEWLQIASGLLASDKDAKGNSLPVTWVTPAGFPVRQKYPKYKLKHIKTVLNGTISVQDPEGEKEMTQGEIVNVYAKVQDGDQIDSRKQRQGIAPNFVHSLDASHLMLTVNACYDQGIRHFAMIHDSYGTHAGNADILYKTVREVFVDTYTKHDVLKELRDHVAMQLSPKNLEKLPELPQRGSLDLTCVLQSIYAFS